MTQISPACLALAGKTVYAPRGGRVEEGDSLVFGEPMKLLGSLLLISGVFIFSFYGSWMALEAYVGHATPPDVVALAAVFGLAAATCFLGALMRY